MLSFEEALKSAQKVKKRINGCTEYTNGYMFWYDDDGPMKVGGTDSPCVVLKKDGRVVPMPVFVAFGTGKEIGDIPIEPYVRV